MRRYTIITGYHDSPFNQEGQDTVPFFRTWLSNTRDRFPDALDVYVMDTKPARLPPESRDVRWLGMLNNPGHVHHLDHKLVDFPPRLCGWSLCFITGALLAYYNNSDLLFKEQDCLAFGSVIDKAYEALGSAGVMTGSVEDSLGVGLEQSLVLMRRDFIPDFCSRLLAHPRNDGGPNFLRPEAKWRELLQSGEGALFPFGYGRRRPKALPPDDEAWYIQKVTPDELRILREKGKVS